MTLLGFWGFGVLLEQASEKVKAEVCFCVILIYSLIIFYKQQNQTIKFKICWNYAIETENLLNTSVL